MHLRSALTLAAGLFTFPAEAYSAQDLTALLGFEVEAVDGAPAGWAGGPAGTLFLDCEAAHGGSCCGRLERTPESEKGFSNFGLSIPVEFRGQRIELRGWLRTEGVTDYAGLWLREDGESGMLRLDNMNARRLKGTTPWTEYRITLPLDAGAEKLVFGALVSGQGRVWVDDLSLYVDGLPLAQAPKPEQPTTILDIDHEFDGDSRIHLRALSAQQTAALVTLGKVWGFLKYHHPEAVEGRRHWDYELFRVMPRVLAAARPDEVAAVLSAWIDELGVPTACAPCAGAPKDVQLAAPLAWIRDEARLGPALSARLQAIHKYRSDRQWQFTVKLMPGVGNPDFSAELAYPGLTLPDTGYRILALYRFWNMTSYWFPYRDLITADWDGVLAEFLSRLVAVQDRETYTLELLAFAALLEDGHASLWSELALRPPRGEASVPVTLRFVAGEPVVSGYSNPELGPATGLLPGDRIESIDGEPVAALIAKWSALYPASNAAARLNAWSQTLLQGPAGPVALGISRDQERLTLSALRAPRESLDLAAGSRHDRPGPACQRLAEDIVYLKLSSVARDSIAGYLETMRGARGLIIDIRNYPSAFMVFDLCGHFVTRRTEFARFSLPDPANPGAFRWSPPVAIPPLTPHFDGRVVVLVDETSMSQAEYTAMALRAVGATILGSTTAGADGNVSRIPLPGGLAAAFSGIGVFYPDQRPTQKLGIVPDLRVEPTLAGIRAGRDEVLDAAIAEVRRPAQR